MKQKSAKQWVFLFLGIQGVIFAVWIGVTVVVDPYFHYHKPLEGIAYRLYEERYINHGIAKNFEFDALMTGTSMTQNFKTSDMDAIFGVSSVKLPFSGGGYAEIAKHIQKAGESQEALRVVVWGLDYNGLIREADWTQYADYPAYLYDENPFNDVSYLLNKAVMYHGTLTNLLMTLQGEESTSFDEYSSWSTDTGLTRILEHYPDMKLSFNTQKLPMQEEISEQERTIVEESIQKNVIPVIEQNPDTEFYLFFTPYSILYWDNLWVEGRTKVQIQAEGIAVSLLLEYDNVKLYNFFDNTDLICNLSNYKDKEHYAPEVNTQILEWMKAGEYRLTKENLDKHLRMEEIFFTEYPYTKLYEGR